MANPAQREAITTTEGPVLIVAGPGSGKTYTLVERTIHLIKEKGVRPENILIATFTEKAAAELTTRISNRLLSEGIRLNLNEMYLGTFHGICLRLLEENREHTRLSRNFSVLDDFDQHFLIYANVKRLAEELPDLKLIAPEDQSNWRRSGMLQAVANHITEEYLDFDALVAAPEELVRAGGLFYRAYQNLLEEQNTIDFSGIQKEALELLRSKPAVHEKLNEQIRYLMIDEYQDTNTIQELILKELHASHANVCVVGDDDQGLYRFRGATIRNILEFPGQFDGRTCRTLKLQTNYRSHPDIIDFYTSFIEEEDWKGEKGPFRYAKKIGAPPEEEFPNSAAVLRVTGKSEQQWHEHVLRFITSLRDEGKIRDLNQVAFLFRSLASPKVQGLISFLEENGIPVYAPRSDFFFQREEVRLALGLLQLLFPQYPTVRSWAPNAHLSIWDYYDEQCLPTALDCIQKPEHKDLLAYVRQKALLFKNLPEGKKSTDLSFSRILYQLFAFEPVASTLDFEPRARNLAVLTQILTRFEHSYRLSVLTSANVDRMVVQLFNQFMRFLREGGINEYEDPENAAPSGAVPFFTVHQSKGLEFPVVMVGSLGSVPRKDSDDFEDAVAPYLRREPFEPADRIKFFDWRRLFYTAFSRAQSVLVLTDVEKLEGRGRHTPSKYMQPAFQRAVDWPSERFRPELLELKPVRPAHLKREYSFTGHITVYENCARQYKFFRHWDFAPTRQGAMAFGQLIHQTIEDIHKEYLRNPAANVEETRIREWLHSNYQLLILKERAYLAPAVLESALNQVISYFERSKERFANLKEAEVNVSLVKDDYILIGSVDLITGDEGTVEIVDFKGQRKPDLSNSEQVSQYRRQLEIYAHIVEEKFGWRVSRMHIYYTAETEGSPYLTFAREQEHIDRTLSSFDEVVKRIETGDFRIRELPLDLCKNCDFRTYCQMKGTA